MTTEISELLKVIDSPYLLVLAAFLIFIFTKDGFFSKIGREATTKIVFFIVYGLFILAVLPALKEIIGQENSVYVISFAIALGMVVHIIKYILRDKMNSLKTNDLSNSGNLAANQIYNKVGFNKENDSFYFSVNKKETEEQQKNILEEISDLLLYKKAMTEDSAEVWSELMKSEKNSLNMQCKINIIQFALQSKSVKNKTALHVKILSDLGNIYFDYNDLMNAVSAFEKSLAINTININPDCLIQDCIFLGRSYVGINKSQELDSMYDKARAYYIMANELNIELNQETINLMNGAFSNLATHALQPS